VALSPDVDLAFLEERYGTGRSVLAIGILTALVVLPFLGWVVWAGLLQADEDLRWNTTGFRDATDTSVVIEFDVFLPAGSEVTCTVRALDRRGVEVGRAEVPVTSDSSDTRVVYALQVTARPSSALVETCRPLDGGVDGGVD
jgi:hypothetical protein